MQKLFPNFEGNAKMTPNQEEPLQKLLRNIMEIFPSNQHNYDKFNISVVSKADIDALKRFADAISSVQSLEMKNLVAITKGTHAWNWFGRVLDDLGEKNYVFKIYDAIVKISPDDFDALTSFGFAMRGSGNAKDAIRIYRRAIISVKKYFIDNVEEDIYTKFLYSGMWSGLGASLRDMGDIIGTIDAYNEAIEINDQESIFEPGLHLELGNVLLERGAFENAIFSFDEALGSIETLYKMDGKGEKDAIYGDPIIWIRFGDLFRELGDLKRSRIAYFHGSKKEPEQDIPFSDTRWDTYIQAIIKDSEVMLEDKDTEISEVDESDVRKSFSGPAQILKKQDTIYYNLRYSETLTGALVKILRIRPDYADAWSLLGRIHLASLNGQDDSDKEAAIEAHRKAVTLDSKDAQKWIFLGEALDFYYHVVTTNDINIKNAMRSAIEAFHEAIIIEPQNARAWANLCSVLHDSGDTNGSIEACRKAIVLGADNARVWDILSSELKNMGDEKGSIDASEKSERIRSSVTKKSIHLGADIIVDIDTLQKLLVIKPDYIDAWKYLGNALYDSDDIEGAINSYQKVLSLKPDDFYTWIDLAFAFNKNNNVKSAIEAFQQAILIKSDDIHPWMYLGNLLNESGDTKGAINAYRKMTRIDAGYLEGWKSLGNALKKSGNVNDVIKAYEKAILLDPKDDKTLFSLGVTYEDRGDMERAINAYKRSVKINPDNSEAEQKVEDADIKKIIDEIDQRSGREVLMESYQLTDHDIEDGLRIKHHSDDEFKQLRNELCKEGINILDAVMDSQQAWLMHHPELEEDPLYDTLSHSDFLDIMRDGLVAISQDKAIWDSPLYEDPVFTTIRLSNEKIFHIEPDLHQWEEFASIMTNFRSTAEEAEYYNEKYDDFLPVTLTNNLYEISSRGKALFVAAFRKGFL